MEVGKEIHRQITHPKVRARFWCWAAGAFKVFGGESFNKDINHRGGLLFKVSANHHKSHVMVRLLGSDYYRVDFGRLQKGEFIPSKNLEPLEEVGCHNLVELIDEKIEKIPEYRY